MAGRTHVHSKVASVITDAYSELSKQTPDVAYVYGETGWSSGGSIKPHRTHQCGLSVDFFVPVRNQAGKSFPIPTGPTNKFGYSISFDANAKHDDYAIDFPAIGERLYQVDLAAKRQGVGIALVIFEPAYLPMLFATPRGQYLKDHLPFMKGKAWVRHDQHYHVDFSIRCKP